jgi:hypothetical protein
MSDRYRNGAFALGLVTGVGIALNLFLWLDYRARQAEKTNSPSDQASQNSQVGKYWDGLIGTFVSPSDTLAQWIMATFTIAATVVLILTLRSANKTNRAAIDASNAAIEANEIMRREQRPWIYFVEPRITDVLDSTSAEEPEGSVTVLFSISVKNSGAVPSVSLKPELRLKLPQIEKHEVGTGYSIPPNSNDLFKSGIRHSFKDGAFPELYLVLRYGWTNSSHTGHAWIKIRLMDGNWRGAELPVFDTIESMSSDNNVSLMLSVEATDLA